METERGFKDVEKCIEGARGIKPNGGDIDGLGDV
jgi:hypothetical protein